MINDTRRLTTQSQPAANFAKVMNKLNTSEEAMLMSSWHIEKMGRILTAEIL
jgi:hypothetical protein